MSSTATTDLTGLLRAWSAGDSAAGEKLIPLVYRELHHQAARYLSRERSNHTLRPTALVNEAYLRLARQRRVVWQDRAQFFGVAATVMRRLLVDHARQHAASKRGALAVHRLARRRGDHQHHGLAGSRHHRPERCAVGADGRRSGPGAHDRAAVLCRIDDRRDGRGDGRVGRHRDARLAAGAGLAASSAHEGIAATAARRRGIRSRMTPERWKRLAEIFESALEREPAARADFLAAACADDPSLLSEVEELLHSHEQAGAFGTAPAFHVAAIGAGSSGTSSVHGHGHARSRVASGALRDRQPARRRRHGRGLSCARPTARPRGRHQDSAAGAARSPANSSSASNGRRARSARSIIRTS